MPHKPPWKLFSTRELNLDFCQTVSFFSPGAVFSCANTQFSGTGDMLSQFSYSELLLIKPMNDLCVWLQRCQRFIEMFTKCVVFSVKVSCVQYSVIVSVFENTCVC